MQIAHAGMAEAVGKSRAAARIPFGQGCRPSEKQSRTLGTLQSIEGD
jgi:hypothetical protein